MNFSYDPTKKEDMQVRFLMEQSQLWEERSIEVKDFINKYGWCKRN